MLVRRKKETLPDPSLLVLLVEFVKLVISVYHANNDRTRMMKYSEVEPLSPNQRTRSLFKIGASFWLFAVPGFIYAATNALTYVVLKDLEVGTYAIISVAKIPITAFLMRLTLGKKLRRGQWLALALLICGSLCSVVSFDKTDHIRAPARTVALTIFGNLLSAIAAIWSEYLLKGSNQNMHVQNAQLYFHGVVACAIAVYVNRLLGTSTGRIPVISDPTSWISVITLTGIGLSSAVVMKYADNIVRLFLSGTSLGVSKLLSNYFFDEKLDVQHGVGCVLILSAFMVYEIPASRV